MKRFRYVLDPLCIGACLLYALNRWGIKPHTHYGLFRFWFNDALLIPCALPPLLAVHRWLGLRANDGMPTNGEILGHVTFWSLLFEVIGPHWSKRTTGDPVDVAVYALGALVAWAWWRRENFLWKPTVSK